MKDKLKRGSKSISTIQQEQVKLLQQELTNVRDEVSDNKYIQEARVVLAAGGLRSAIGAYWNAVIDDLRKKIVHRSLDLFNKEVKLKIEIKSYEDFQNHVTDFDLIEGAYRIGVISWEGYKLLNQARETRNIFDGHPDSSNPTIVKVFNMFADCNRYVLSQDYPLTVIDVNNYILTMDSDAFNKNEVAVEQAFTDLPLIYKTEMANRLFSLYIGDSASTRLKSNIEFSYPILWDVISKEIRQQIGKRFDRLLIEGNMDLIENAKNLLTIVDGLRYVSSASRRILFEPVIKNLEDNLNNWSLEGKYVQQLQRLGSNIPAVLLKRFVSAITLTYVGFKGGSGFSDRTAFYSNSAAPKIEDMFEKFDNASTEAFVEVIKNNSMLKGRIKFDGQLDRLRTLGSILLKKPEIREDTKEFLEILVDKAQTRAFQLLIK